MQLSNMLQVTPTANVRMYTHLRHGVTLAQCNTLALQCLEVNGDCIRHANLVCASVALADGVACRWKVRMPKWSGKQGIESA
jgi:hypothetical protein